MSQCTLVGVAALNSSPLALPVGIKVGAGQSRFASPAQGHEMGELDLSEKLITNPPTTFYFWVEGDSMTGAGIFDGDLLLVDKSLNPRHNSIVVADVDGEWLVKRLQYSRGLVSLLSENPDHAPIVFRDGQELFIFGVVTYAIHKPQ